MKKRIEISYINSVKSWNSNYGTIIELYEPIGDYHGHYRTYRMELSDLTTLLKSVNPEYEIIEPQGSRKYTYLKPIIEEKEEEIKE